MGRDGCERRWSEEKRRLQMEGLLGVYTARRWGLLLVLIDRLQNRPAKVQL